MNRFNSLLQKYAGSPAPENSLESIQNKINGPSSGLYEGSMPSQKYQELLNQSAAPTIQLGPQQPSTPMPEEKSSGGFDPKSLMNMLPKPAEQKEEAPVAAAAPVQTVFPQLSNDRNSDARQSLLDSFKAIKARGGLYGNE